MVQNFKLWEEASSKNTIGGGNVVNLELWEWRSEWENQYQVKSMLATRKLGDNLHGSAPP